MWEGQNSLLFWGGVKKKKEKMDFTNKNWKKYIRDDDKVLGHFKASEKSELWTALWWGTGLSISMIFTIILLPFFLVWAFTFYKGMNYVISQKGIYYIRGVLFKKIKFIPYTKITDITLKRGLLESTIFNTGTIGISTAGGTKNPYNPYEITLRYLENYKEVNNLISKKI